MPLKLKNDAGERCASLPFQEVEGRAKLDDLWFIWSRCNLECAHCYVSSSPFNNNLEMPEPEEVRPFLEEGRRFGLGHVYYTGGEPFIHPRFVELLELSLEFAPVTVLTNATRPIARHWEGLERIHEKWPGRLTFRVSLDHYEEEGHDEIRGEGNFGRTIENTRRLLDIGFGVILTSTPIVYEGNPITQDEAEERYRALFDGYDVEIKVLPTTLAMGAELTRRRVRPRQAFLSQRVFGDTPPSAFQCHNGRSVQKIGGEMRVYPCPIIYNDADFDMGGSLEESFGPVPLAHHACYTFCYYGQGSCTDTGML